MGAGKGRRRGHDGRGKGAARRLGVGHGGMIWPRDRHQRKRGKKGVSDWSVAGSCGAGLNNEGGVLHHDTDRC